MGKEMEMERKEWEGKIERVEKESERIKDAMKVMS